jgi:hypothetical protein
MCFTFTYIYTIQAMSPGSGATQHVLVVTDRMRPQSYVARSASIRLSGIVSNWMSLLAARLLAPSVLSIQQCGCVLSVDKGNVDTLRVQELIELQHRIFIARAWVGHAHNMGLRPHHCYCGGCSHGEAIEGGELLLG